MMQIMILCFFEHEKYKNRLSLSLPTRIHVILAPFVNKSTFFLRFPVVFIFMFSSCEKNYTYLRFIYYICCQTTAIRWNLSAIHFAQVSIIIYANFCHWIREVSVCYMWKFYESWRWWKEKRCDIKDFISFFSFAINWICIWMQLPRTPSYAFLKRSKISAWNYISSFEWNPFKCTLILKKKTKKKTFLRIDGLRIFEIIRNWEWDNEKKKRTRKDIKFYSWIINFYFVSDSIGLHPVIWILWSTYSSFLCLFVFEACQEHCLVAFSLIS